MAVIKPLDFFFHLSLLLLCVGDLEEWLNLCEQAPPLPVSQLQVALDVALDDADGSVLFHTLLVGPGQRSQTKKKVKTVKELCTCQKIYIILFR